MVHEVFLPLEGTLKQKIAATIQRLMIRLLLCGCRCAFASTIYYCKLLQESSPVPAPLIKHMPIYSNIPVVEDSDRVLALRKRILGTRDSPKHIIGHFSTFNGMITPLLKNCLRLLFIAEPEIRFLLLGKGSDEFTHEIRSESDELADCCISTGMLDADEVSLNLQCCDLMLQPCPGGVTTRHTSVLASLSHGKPVATFSGWQTEHLWKIGESLVFSSGDDVNDLCYQILAVLRDRERLARIGTAAKLLYSGQFAAEMSIQRFAGKLAE